MQEMGAMLEFVSVWNRQTLSYISALSKATSIQL